MDGRETWGLCYCQVNLINTPPLSTSPQVEGMFKSKTKNTLSSSRCYSPKTQTHQALKQAKKMKGTVHTNILITP